MKKPSRHNSSTTTHTLCCQTPLAFRVHIGGLGHESGYHYVYQLPVHNFVLNAVTGDVSGYHELVQKGEHLICTSSYLWSCLSLELIIPCL